MAEILLAAGAAYLGLKAARKVKSAYSNTKAEMYEEQYANQQYYQPTYSHVSRGYTGSSGGYYPPSSGQYRRSGSSYGYY